jgi:myosin V
MRREAASITIQTYIRRHHAIKAFIDLLSASITIQAALRGMAAREEFLFRRQTKAAVVIQVDISCIVLL